VWFGKAFLKTYQAEKRAFSSFFVKKRSSGLVEIQKIDVFPDEMDDFWKQVRSEYEMCLERNATFLNWRFSRHFGDYHVFLARSLQNKNVVGYMVLKKTRILNIQNVLDIVDLQSLHDENECVLNLIDIALDFAKNEGLDLVHSRVPSWHRYTKLLSNRGFIFINYVSRLLKIPQPHVVLHPFGNEQIVPKFRRWFYTLADTDYE
jgi:hypothetical protein